MNTPLFRLYLKLSQWRKSRKEQAVARTDAANRRAIAFAFNKRYTYRHEWKHGMPYLPGSFYGVPHRSGYAWMCYECNSVHHPVEDSVFSGLQYPACCSTQAGHRLDEKLFD